MSSSDDLNRKDFLKELAQYAETQRQLIEAECESFPVDSQASKQRRVRAHGDFQYFCKTYFPHYVTGDPSLFHEYAFERFPACVDDPIKGYHEAIAAPRGEAKSTIITQLMSIWCTVTERKRFIGIIMDAIDQAEQMLAAIKVELESNPRLAMDFPKATGGGPIWRVDEIVTANNRKIKAAGATKKLRGWRFGPHRPDLILLDDIENDENVKQKVQRDKLQSWLRKAVMKLGPPDGTMDIFYVGTILHYDSVLNRTLKSPTWNSRVFSAIVKWPDRMDLWDQWEAIYHNQGEDEADRFYQQNQFDMNAGAVVSWPKTRPLLLLMKIRAEDHHSFDCELQNDPSNSDNAPFKDIQYWIIPCRDWLFYGSIDPSLGKNNKARDPSAILVGGFDRENMILDVVEAKIARRVPDKIIQDAIALQREYHCRVWGVESVQFQEFLRTQLIKAAAKEGIAFPARPVIPNNDKNLRIESLQPYVANGQIRLHHNQATLKEQLGFWPEADHDDGPDALEILWKLANGSAIGIPTVKTRRRRYSTRSLRGY